MDSTKWITILYIPIKKNALRGSEQQSSEYRLWHIQVLVYLSLLKLDFERSCLRVESNGAQAAGLDVCPFHQTPTLES